MFQTVHAVLNLLTCFALLQSFYYKDLILNCRMSKAGFGRQQTLKEQLG